MRNPNGPSIEEKEQMAEHLADLNEKWLNRKWFVMLRSQTRTLPIPLVDLEDDVVLFGSEEEAAKAGQKNPIGEAFGFEVFPWED
jgi:hypothetical protein